MANDQFNTGYYISGQEERPRPKFQPYVTFSLIALCVIVFFVQQSSLDFFLTFAMDPLYPKPWMFVTSVFLHSDVSHIFLNMFILFMFGRVLERIIGWKLYIGLFLLAGIAGNVGYLVFCHLTGSFYYSLGASGAIYGVFACLAILLPDMKIYLMFFIPMKIIYALGLFALVDIFFINAADNVAHSAHLAGLAVGLAFALYLRKEMEERKAIRQEHG